MSAGAKLDQNNWKQLHRKKWLTRMKPRKSFYDVSCCKKVEQNLQKNWDVDCFIPASFFFLLSHDKKLAHDPAVRSKLLDLLLTSAKPTENFLETRSSPVPSWFERTSNSITFGIIAMCNVSLRCVKRFDIFQSIRNRYSRQILGTHV